MAPYLLSMPFEKEELLRISMKRMGLVIGMAALVSGCDGGLSDCERALKERLKAPESYERVDVKEDPRESRSFSGMIITYSFEDTGDKIQKKVMCDIDNNDGNIYISYYRS
jgi:hypothetical protein